jgi:signal transduction histidine kinase
MESVIVAICCFVFLIIITIVFFTKPKMNKLENKTFSWLLILNIIGLLLQVLSYVLVNKYDNFQNTIYYIAIIRMIFCYYVLWELFFVYYITIISFSLNEKDNRLKNTKKITIFFVIGIFIAVQTLILPINITKVNNLYYPTGPAMMFLAIGVLYGIIIIFYCLVKNFKHIINIKYLPLLFYIIFGSISIIWQMSNPGLLLITPIESLVLFLMYFTIENPDMKMLEEVNKAKKISDNANQEKSMFLFNMTKEIRNISRNIDDHADNILSEVTKEETNIENIGDNAREIKYDISKFNTITNDILDVSNIDASNIKIYNTKFNIKLIIKGLVSIYKEKCQEKGLEFRTDIASDIPEYLYGDSINLKKVMITLLDNAIKYTNNGYVELNVNFVKKIDICRLIISIEDSGIGIKPEELDTIFYKKKEELNRNNLKNNLYTAKKIITMMEGTIIANSDYNKGTTMKIVLDAKIVPTKENVYIKEYDNKKILLVDDSETCEKIIKKLLRGSNINIERTEYGKYCLDKIRSKEKYDLILIKDELKPLDGYTIMTKLQEIRNFNIPCILLTKNTKVEYDDSYQKYGFKDYIIKSNDKNKILNTLDKYLK